MKILLFLSMLLILPALVFAQEINFLQESYLPGETVQAEILIPNLVSEINAKNIIINPKLGFFLKKLSDEYYFIYFNLPKDITDGEYNLEIKDILYKENNLLKETSISNKLKINSFIQRDLFTIQPAILEFEKTTPYLKIIIENKESKTITLPITTTNELIKTSITQAVIPANSQKSITVYTEKLEKGKEFLNIGHYKIPIWILKGIPIVTTKPPFSFSIIEDNKEILLDKLKAELNKNQIAYENIYITNLLNKSIYNLSISLTQDLKKIIKLNTTFIQEIKPNEKITEYILINENRNPKYKLYKGSILLESENYKSEFPIELKIIQEEIEIDEEPKKIILDEEVKEIKKEKPKIEIKEKSPLYFIITIIGIILLFIIIYLIIPKKH